MTCSSCHYFSARCLRNIASGSRYRLVNASPTLSGLTWRRSVSQLYLLTLRKVTLFLGPFKDATITANGDKYVTLSCVSPVYDVLLDHIQTSLDGLTANDELRGSIIACQDKLKSYSDIKSEYAYAATVLDPRFKASSFGTS